MQQSSRKGHIEPGKTDPRRRPSGMTSETNDEKAASANVENECASNAESSVVCTEDAAPEDDIAASPAGPSSCGASTEDPSPTMDEMYAMYLAKKQGSAFTGRVPSTEAVRYSERETPAAAQGA